MAWIWSVAAMPVAAEPSYSGVSVADTVLVEGVVTSRDMGQPIPGAVVSVLGTAHEATTDAVGRFRLEGVSSGDATFVVMANGFRLLRRSVTVVSPGPVVVPFELEAATLPDGILETAERMPEIIGGIETLARKVIYPSEALQRGVGGAVLVRFVVDEHGAVLAPEVISGVGSGCDEEAVRVVRESRFLPGREGGRVVKVRMTLSVPFDLEAARSLEERSILVRTGGSYFLEGQPRSLDQIVRDSDTAWSAVRVVVLVEPDHAAFSASKTLTRALEQAGATQINVKVAWPEDEEIYVIVEQMPELIGGLDEVQRRLRYPAEARQAGIHGRVIVQFVVDVDGRVIAPAVVRGLLFGCDEEAIRVVRTLRFRPGIQDGKPVRVKMSLPLTFRLR